MPFGNAVTTVWSPVEVLTLTTRTVVPVGHWPIWTGVPAPLTSVRVYSPVGEPATT
jgi:hypothetical protein